MASVEKQIICQQQTLLSNSREKRPFKWISAGAIFPALIPADVGFVVGQGTIGGALVSQARQRCKRSFQPWK